jgi:hypothetical protein
MQRRRGKGKKINFIPGSFCFRINSFVLEAYSCSLEEILLAKLVGKPLLHHVPNVQVSAKAEQKMPVAVLPGTKRKRPNHLNDCVFLLSCKSKGLCWAKPLLRRGLGRLGGLVLLYGVPCSFNCRSATSM